MMKKLVAAIHHMPRRFTAIGALCIIALGLLIPSTAFAASATPAGKCSANDTSCWINLGNSLIGKRQADLTKLTNRVNDRLNDHLITSDQASVLQSDIATNQNGLSALQTKLDAETSAQAAKQDVVNIFLQFRIYAVVLPRDYRRLYYDIAVNVDAKMRGVSQSVEEAIEKAPANEQQQLNALYNDYKSQLSTAEGQFDQAAADFPALTPANFNYNRSSYDSTLSNLNSALKTIHTSLHQAGSDLHQIAQILKDK